MSATLSVCMIVKNESQHLAGSLRSLRALKPLEIVVVDTGSTDNTVEIARNYGSVVVRRDWTDDFAAARNCAIDHARGNWCLTWDADHRLPKHSVRHIHTFMCQNTYGAGRVSLHEASTLTATVEQVLAGTHRIGQPWQPIQLYRRVSSFGDVARYSGCVHESVDAWLYSRGMTDAAIVGADVVHYGGIPTERERLHKGERNERLLLKRIEQDANDVEAYGYLALDYYVAQRYDECESAVNRALNLTAGPLIPMVRLLLVRALLHTVRNNPRLIVESVLAAEKIAGVHPDCEYLKGLAAERLGAYAKAIELYESALRLGSRRYAMHLVNGATSWNSLARMGMCQAQLGRFPEAVINFDAALSHPDLDHADLIREARAAASAEVAAA